MRSIVSYILAGFIVLTAIDLIAPPIGFGLAVFAWPTVNGSALHQSVNRIHKGDRLPLPTTSSRPIAPRAAPVLVGCEPVFSALSNSRRANYPGRCIS